MITMIAFAKTMTERWSGKNTPMSTEPLWLERALRYAERASHFSSDDLEELLKVNSKIAAETQRRYQMLLHDEAEQLPSMAAYTGAVFRQCAVSSWSSEDWLYAQDHLRIMSCIYGMLRPLDRISPYRMEGLVSLGDHCADGTPMNLFQAWRPFLTPALIADAMAEGGILVNLASEEMKLFFDWPQIESQLHIVKPDFYQRESCPDKSHPNPNKLKSVTMYAKMCRGEMVRYIIQHRIKTIEELRKFEWEGFRYDPFASEEASSSHPKSEHLIFVREI